MDEMMMARLEHYGIPRPPEPWMALEEPDHLLTLLERGGFPRGTSCA